MKNIKQYNDYILEKYSADWSRIGSTLYYFNIESNKYFVKFSDTYNLVYVSFGIVDENEKWSYKDLDKSNAFKTMSTVSEIIKDFISKMLKRLYSLVGMIKIINQQRCQDG